MINCIFYLINFQLIYIITIVHTTFLVVNTLNWLESHPNFAV